MEVINQTSEWFKTDEAISMYNSLESLADKTVFLYSYLSKIADKSFRENKTLFKMAFLLADAISKSNLPYNEYEVLIDGGFRRRCGKQGRCYGQACNRRQNLRYNR